ncbi:MAG: ABC transporter ATP-binding protein [Marinifilaceae bacterium]
MNSVLAVENLDAGYVSGFSIKDINFAVKEGEFVSVIGPNGAGKSTLFKTLTGLLRPTSGKILLNDSPVDSLSIKERARRVAIVNQRVDAGDMRVEEYVMLGRLPYRKPFQFLESDEDYAVVTESMELAGIAHKREIPMYALSGGEQQLAAVARALAQQTSILLLDEPTSSLDICHQMNVLNLLQRLNKEKHLTVVLIIHDLNLASEYSDRLILLNEGTVHKIGMPEEVLTYENIEQVYKSLVLTHKSPITGKPFIFPISAQTMEKYNKDM